MASDIPLLGHWGNNRYYRYVSHLNGEVHFMNGNRL